MADGLGLISIYFYPIISILINMPKPPEILSVEGQPNEPELIGFLSLKPDESLRVVPVVPSSPDEPVMVELIKLETPLGTDDVAMSGYKKVGAETINNSMDYLRGLNPRLFSESEAKRLYEVLRQVIEIKDLFI